MASLNEVVRRWMESKKKQLKGRMAGCNISDGRCSLLTGAGRTRTLIERYSYGSAGRTVLLEAGDSVHALIHAQMCQNQHMEVSTGSPH
jgi:hypothetical protein